MANTDNFCAEIRSKDAVDKHAEVDVRAYDKTMGSDLSRVQAALESIRHRGYIGKQMTALDIGSGTGAFTLAFAKEYASVSALDISHGMQNIIREKAELQGSANIEYIFKNWHHLNLQEQGMDSKYDMVLSSLNTRGIYNFETLVKMNQASKGGCCLVSFTGRGKKNHSAALNSLIIGRQLTSAGGNDIIMPFNLIYHMGGKPDMAYSSIAWRREFTAEDALRAITHQYWRFAEITPELEVSIKDYISTQLDENGMYVETANVPVAIMVWDAQPVKDYIANE